MNWKYATDSCGGWYWFSDNLPNGWCGSVTDMSQSVSPQKPTRYLYSAACPWWIVPGDWVDTLQEAKSRAVELAMLQGTASSDPRCRSDYEVR